MGREENCKQICLACVASAHSVYDTLGLPLLRLCVLSQSTLLRLQVALQGNYLKQALRCVHLPGLSHSGSASRVFHKDADSIGPSGSGDQVLGKCTLLRWSGALYHLPGPSCSVSWVRSGSAISGVPSVSSGELISGCDPPDGCQLSRIPGRLG